VLSATIVKERRRGEENVMLAKGLVIDLETTLVLASLGECLMSKASS